MTGLDRNNIPLPIRPVRRRILRVSPAAWRPGLFGLPWPSGWWHCVFVKVARGAWVAVTVGLGCVFGVAGRAAPADAAAVGVVPAGVLEAVADPGIVLHVPGDGRLDGDGFAGVVTGYRFASTVGYGTSARHAASGQELLVFGVQGLPLASGQGGGQSSLLGGAAIPPVVSALLVVDGAQEALPPPVSPGGGPAYFLASVPSGASSVELQVSAQGFAQTFSFSAGARVGVSPVVLYRSKGSWEATDPVGETVTMQTPDPAENLSGAEIDVTVSSGVLTWFGPAGTSDYPPGPGDAWLVLNASSQAHPLSVLPVGFQLNYLSTLSGSQVTLTIPGVANPLPASIAGQGGPSDESTNDSGFFGGVYYWQVPADLSTATVTVTPGTITAEDNYLGSPQTVKVPGSAVFDLSFGSLYQPPPAPASPPPDASASQADVPARTPVASARTAGRSTGTSGPLDAGLIGAGLLAVAGAGVLVRNRRETRAASRRAERHSPRPDSFGPAGPGRSDPGRADPGRTTAGAAGDPLRADPPAPYTVVPPSAQRTPVEDATVEDATVGAERDRDPTGTAAPGEAHDGGGNGESGTPALGPSTVAARPSHPVLVDVWAGPPPVGDGEVRVEVLGSPRVVGWPAGAPPLGHSVAELLVFLVLHPGETFTAEQLRARLGAGRTRDVDPGTIRRYVNELRRALGDAAVPVAKPGGGYEIIGVAADAISFGRLVDTKLAGDGDPTATASRLAEALSMLRGAPFSDAPKGCYGWADIEAGMSAGLSNSARHAAVTLAGMALQAGDVTLAGWAAAKGLLVSPTDDELCGLALQAAASTPGGLDLAWAQTINRLAAYEETPSQRLANMYRNLRGATA